MPRYTVAPCTPVPINTAGRTAKANIFEQQAAMISHSSGANASACSPPSYLSRQQAIPQQPQPMSFEGGNCNSV